MRLVSLESVLRWQGGFAVMDLGDDGWTQASRESLWFEQGERLSRDFQQLEDGTLVDKQGRLVLRRR